MKKTDLNLLTQPKLALVILSLIFFISSLAAYADDLLVDSAHTQWHPVIGVGGGVVITTNIGKSTNFSIVDPITDEFYNYTASNQSQHSGLFEAFLGAEHWLFSNWLAQVGLAYAQTGSLPTKGSLIQGADIQSSDRYNYQFKTIARQLLIQGKLLLPFREKYFPYLLLGLGSSFNSTYSFTTTTPQFMAFTRQYANRSSSAFSYRIGLGCDVALTPHSRIGIAYRFSDLGGFELGAAQIDGINVPGTLFQSSLNANEVLAQFTYVM